MYKHLMYQRYLETLKHVRKETKKSTTGNDKNPTLTQRVAKHSHMTLRELPLLDNEG